MIRSPVHKTRDVPQLVGIVDRPVEQIFVIGVIAGSRGRRRLAELCHELVIDPGLAQHPGRRRTVLAAVEVAATLIPSTVDGKIGVVEHHDRGLAAQLEVGDLDVGRRRRRHRDARPGWSR